MQGGSNKEMEYVVIGLIAGAVSGLGMGGGTILILILTLWAGLEQIAAQATNLVFFIPTALIAVILHIKRKNVRKEIWVPIAIFGSIGAAIGAYMAMHIEMGLLRKLFGYFLLWISLHEMYTLYKMYKNEKNTHTTSKENKEEG